MTFNLSTMPTSAPHYTDDYDNVEELTLLAITFTLLMTVCILATVIGNILVVLSIFTYRPLRGVQNFYIVSLAVADLAVAVFVMPFNIANTVVGRWQFGAVLCNAWLTSDIFLCTASILNLCAIAVDRYYAIHDPINYAQKRTLARVMTGIAVVWLASAIISIPPLFGWNNSSLVGGGNNGTTITLYNVKERTCQLTDERSYVLYSAAGSFYVPLVLMAFIYFNIYIATRARLRARANWAAVTSSAASVFNRSVRGRVERTEQRGLSSGALLLQRQSSIDHHKADMVTVAGTSNAAGLPAQIVNKKTGVNNACETATNETQSGSLNSSDVDHHLSTLSSEQRGTEGAEQTAAINVASVVELTNIGTVLLISSRSSCRKYGAAFFRNSISTRPSNSGQSPDTSTRLIETPRNSLFSRIVNHERPSSGDQSVIVPGSQLMQFLENKQRISLSKERRAARTMAIIMGVFVLCWLPFFLVYVIMPFCETCKMDADPRLINFTVWLGYINSTLNPIIYTVFNVDFQRAFTSILRCNCRRTS